MSEHHDTGRTAFDITGGLPDRALDALNPYERRVVAILLARASERAYRRGFQQGSHFALKGPGHIPDDVHQWRYGSTTDISPWADCGKSELSIDRLHLENRQLFRLGLPEERNHIAGRELQIVADTIRDSAQLLIDYRRDHPDDEEENGANFCSLMDQVEAAEGACPVLLTEILTGQRADMSPAIIEQVHRALASVHAGDRG